MGKIIGIVSGKGGVGKTTTTANLGLALQLLGNSVCIIDANVTTANLGLHFGITHYPVTVHEILKNDFPVLDSVFVHQSGLRIITGSLSLENAENVQVTKLRKILETLAQTYAYVLVDSAPGLETQAMAIAQSCDELLVVVNLDLPSVTDAIKIIEFAREKRIAVGGLIINKIFNKNFELKPDEIESVTNVPVIAMVPFDMNIPRSIAAKMPLVQFLPTSPAALEFKTLATRLSGIIINKKGVFDWIKKMFTRTRKEWKAKYEQAKETSSASSVENFKENLKKEIIKKLGEKAVSEE